MSDMIQRKLEMISLGMQNEPICWGKMYPPCFESLEQYRGWMDASDPELGSKPPPRTDWPGEPNYCRDCSPRLHREMRKQNRCLFPSTTFITSGEGEDEELIGVTKHD